MHLINCSYEKWHVSNSLTIISGKTYFKRSGSKHGLNNFQPISILSTFSKIMEKLFLTRLNSLLGAKIMLYSRQFGCFREGLSTNNPV